MLASKGEETKGVNQYVHVNSSEQQLTTGFGPRAKIQTYTNTLGPQTSQEEFYTAVGLPALDHLWEGTNATLLTYGPRGSGKRHTSWGTDQDQGLIPRITKQLFQRLSSDENSANSSYKMEFSFFELYCEKCNDLLVPSGRNLAMTYIDQVGYHASGLTRCPVTEYATLETILESSLTARAVSAVSTNTDTIQSHTFFQLVLTRTSVNKTTMKAGETTATLLIGDLGDAGGGEEERAAINSVNNSPGNSHAALRSVLKHLKSRTSSPGEERDALFNRSSLTQVLRNSLCGNSNTTLIVALPPSDIDQTSTDFTLAVANQFKQIRTDANAASNMDGRSKEIDNIKTAINGLRSKMAAISSSDAGYVGVQQELTNGMQLLGRCCGCVCVFFIVS